MTALQRIGQLIQQPSAFFTQVKSEKSIWTSFWYYMAAAGIGAIGGWAVQIQSQDVQKVVDQAVQSGLTVPSFLLHPSPFFFAGLFAASFVWSLAGLFIAAFFLHAWIKMWKGQGSYADTFRLIAYCSLPSIALAWVPVLGGFIWIYALVLNVIAIQKLHSLSRAKAIWICVLPSIILVALGALMAIGLVVLFAKAS